MMKILGAAMAVALLAAAAPASAQVNPNNHYVSPHTNSNGTTVQGHYQTNPNSTQRDNYSTQGNTNPYTGRQGTVNPSR